MLSPAEWLDYTREQIAAHLPQAPVAVTVGGAIVDSGHFDWMKHADRFPGLCQPDESYHGITYAERFGNAGVRDH